MSEYIAILTGGEVTIHMPHHDGNYATECGLDGNDPHASVDQLVVDVPEGAKINCRDCWHIFRLAHQYRVSDFEVRP